MKTPAFALLALALLLLASPSSAQYMYLDSNGDGIHTAADVLHGVGPTVVDIWLDIGHNRDGTETSCKSTPPEPFDMFAYVADLMATGGTVSYSAYTNRLSQVNLLGAPEPSDGTRFSTGSFFTPVGVNLPAGRYLLGTLTITVASGTPAVRFAAYSDPGFNDPTLFGTSCVFGLVGPNSQVFGVDWHDADGLAFSAGGSQNGAPVLSPVTAMTAPVGTVQIQGLTATDAEGQGLTFSKIAGPPFLFVTTTVPGNGVAQGEILLSPFRSDLGASTGTIGVSDGAASNQTTFAVTVAAGPNHAPVVVAPPLLTVIAGGVAKIFFAGGDADGDALQFTKVAGPRYLDVRSLAAKPGGAVELLTAAPTLCDVGQATATISVSDGSVATQRNLGLSVVPPAALPDATPHHLLDSNVSDAAAIGDLNRDGFGDLVTTHAPGTAVLVYLGHGDGTFQPPTSVQAQTAATAPTLADLNQDGILDLAVANTAGASISVFLGRGDGTFLPPMIYAVDNGPAAIRTADFNRDGVTDLLVDNQIAGTVSVLLGQGAGAFAAQRSVPAGIQPISPVVSDFNLDGRADVAVANEVPGSVGASVSVLLGLGDGSFGSPLQTPLTGLSAPVSLSSGDWNSDGYLDLAFTDLENDPVRALRGRGDGTFDSPTTVAGFSIVGFPFGSTSGDINADGKADLLVADDGFGRVTIFFGDGSGGFAPPGALDTPNTFTEFVSIGDLNQDGRPDVVAVTPNDLTVFLSRLGPAPAAAARAFVEGGRSMPASAGNNDVTILLEPLNGSYTSDLLNFGSVTLSSDGTGSVSVIHSIAAKRIVEADRDGNGVPEIGVSFAQTDFARLFDQVHGRTTASADLAGSLTDGRPFCADVALTIVGTGHTQQVVFAPNPLNPQSKLSFTTDREGPARALLFDIHGRLVRTLLDQGRLPAGTHEFIFDGKTDRGASLSSGVYFYRVESTGGRSEGQIVVLK